MTGVSDAWVDLANGAALGIAIAAPIGPTAMLCIRNTLARGQLYGLVTGCGAATTHMGYSIAAMLGLAVVLGWVDGLQMPLQLGCAAFLLHMAVRTIRRRPQLAIAAGGSRELRLAYVTGLTWTLSNPMTIIGFTALTPGVLHGEAIARSPHMIALGVLLGSVAWWTALTSLVGVVRSRLSAARLHQINLTMGVILAGLAALIALRALKT